ncbi:MAG: response regulator [Candidatus Margulisbacteria bacterium]|nr:response regulator [Candidatus Margulisiibacteriota bacterium]
MKRILVVEDDEDDRYSLRHYLHKSNFTHVYFSPNSKGALKYLSGNTVDLVIIDTLLPDMNGIELCKTIRENDAYLDIKIIIMTGSYEEINAVHARRAGANDYAVKTAKYSSLIDIIQKTLCTQASE